MLISDVVDIFEVNRRDCARLLLELPKWVPPGTFKSRAAAAFENGTDGPMWQLESCIMEVNYILNQRPEYYSRKTVYSCQILRNSEIDIQVDILHCTDNRAL